MGHKDETQDRPKGKVVEEVADANGWSFRPHYSGRGMYGSECVAIVGPSEGRIVAKLESVGVTDSYRVDSMGKSDVVVYLPGIEYPE